MSLVLLQNLAESCSSVSPCCVAELSEKSCSKLSRGVTALQRQREREEQRRLKRERAMEKRKKKTNSKSLSFLKSILSYHFVLVLDELSRGYAMITPP